MSFFDRFRRGPSDEELRQEAIKQQEKQRPETSKEEIEKSDQSIKIWAEINQLVEAGASDEELKAALAPVAPTRILQMRSADHYWGYRLDGQVSVTLHERLAVASTLIVSLKDRYLQSHDRQLRTYIIKTCISIRAALGDKMRKYGLEALGEIMAAEGVRATPDNLYPDLPNREAGESWMAKPREGDIDPTAIREYSPEQPTTPEAPPQPTFLYPAVLAALAPAEQAFLTLEYWATVDTLTPEMQLRHLFDRIRTAFFDRSGVTDRATVAQAGRFLQVLHENPNLLNVIEDPKGRTEFQDLVDELWEIKGQHEAEVFTYLLRKSQGIQPARPANPTPPPAAPPIRPTSAPTPMAPRPQPAAEHLPFGPTTRLHRELFTNSLSGGFVDRMQLDWSLPERAEPYTDYEALGTVLQRISTYLRNPGPRRQAEAGRMLHFIRQDSEELLAFIPDPTQRQQLQEQINTLWNAGGQQANELWARDYRQ